MRSSVPAGKKKTPGLSTAPMGTFRNVVALSGELFDAIEVNAARTGNHKRAAVRMSRLAEQATPSGMSRAEAHMRAGEQWMLADEPEEAAEEFREAMADAGPTLDDPRVGLARAMFALGRSADAEALLDQLKESEARSVPRTCDLVAELLTEQGDLAGALVWATAGVDACLSGEDRAELQLLLRLRYRLRVDLGLDEDDYDKLLDNRKAGPAAGQLTRRYPALVWPRRPALRRA
jgi:tetratricopeptide (TPR) repeat protein